MTSMGDRLPAVVLRFPRPDPAAPAPAMPCLKSAVTLDPSQFWAILDILPVAVLVGRGRDCASIEGNAAARALLRVPPGQNLSCSAPESERPDFEIHAAGRPVPPSELPMQRAAATGKPVHRSECELRFGSGETVCLAGHSVPLADENGTVRGSIGTFVDITRSKQLERQNQELMRELRRINTQLEQRVRDEMTERETVQARLSQLQRVGALGQLAGGIAHDCNNVLQAVQTAAALILRNPHDPERVARFAGIVATSAEQGSGVTGRLLAFARGEDAPSERVEPVRLLSDLRELLAHTLGSESQVQLDVPPNLPALRAHRRHLESVLINLAVNGRDAMQGGGLLTLGATLCPALPAGTGTVLSDPPPGPCVCLSVGDTGSGMTPEVLARVTEPFFTTKSEGTGLGLAMAHEFARKSGGVLKIDSTPGRGTTVRLWLPVFAA